MNVLYDYQMFQRQYVGGITRYFCELYNNFSNEVHPFVAILINENLYLKEQTIVKKIPFHLLGKFKGKQTLNKLINEINKRYSIYKIAENKFDILHPTYYDPYIFDCKLDKPIIVTVHDMINEVFNHLPETIADKRRQILESDHIIAISENTKNDIVRFFPEIQKNKITVIYHGLNQLPKASNINYFGKYILFVGRRDGYKNFNRFFNGISTLLQKDRDLNLVCVGSKFTIDETEMIVKTGIINQVHQRLVSDAELSTLYKFASVFVFPSCYEGFGFPLLEAFSQNCPVCASNASCFPEIVEDAACYFEPYSIESIRSSIEKVLNDKKYQKQLIDKGKKQLLKYSWKTCADNTYKTYKKIL